jgi:uncharacterized protein YecE (DUF72 family)
MTDREIALDIGKRWLNAEAKVTALETLLNERLPDWRKLLSPILVQMPRSFQKFDALQNAIDGDKSDGSVIRILHQVLFEKVPFES